MRQLRGRFDMHSAQNRFPLVKCRLILHALTFLIAVSNSLQVIAQPAGESSAQPPSETKSGPEWDFGVKAALGYFNFRDSLFVAIDPDPPGNLGDDWLELWVKPWATFEWSTAAGVWFAKASWIYVRTDEDASEIAGGGAHSSGFEDLYLGWQIGEQESGQFEVAGGRYPYQIGHGFLLSDGYADGGSRGGFWSNARTAWAPAGGARFHFGGHTGEVYYLDRDERPESDTETKITGVNYQWRSGDKRWTLGASYFSMDANELAPQRDGAEVWNFRVYTKPFDFPLSVEAEWANENNGLALDATAWYVQPYWTWEHAAWQPTLYYRYAFFQGDNPDTLANEAFDPLFPAFHDWGSWWQGEIAGEYFLSNSNLKTHMLRLNTKPTDRISTGLIYFDYALDQPGSYQGGVVSNDLGKELDWYLDWRVSKLFTFSFVLARAKPGTAVKQAFNRSKDFKYGMIYLAFSY